MYIGNEFSGLSLWAIDKDDFCDGVIKGFNKLQWVKCLIETKNTVIANLNRQVELQNNLNDLIKKIQKNREKKD